MVYNRVGINKSPLSVACIVCTYNNGLAIGFFSTMLNFLFTCQLKSLTRYFGRLVIFHFPRKRIYYKIHASIRYILTSLVAGSFVH